MKSSVPSEYSEAYIALGANLGDREQTLTEAIQMLNDHSDIEIVHCSGLYETAPVGYIDQPSFLNMVLMLRTTLEPESLLMSMLDVENKLGRVRDIRWGPRTVDLDLLWMDNQQLHTERLELPHPRMNERAFVLVPLAELISSDHHPELFQSIQQSLSDIEAEQQGIHYVKAFTMPL
ncbi:2-amino-4-hydroxy-6-hydroxymethyldihydropteridine diphosphokinase [Paenibacillus kyungheensis]